MDITKSSLPVLQECLQLLHPTGEEVVFEVRALKGLDGKYPVTPSGYYNDPAKAIQDILEIDSKYRPETISVTINRVNPTLLARADNHYIIVRGNPVTKDEEALRLTNLFIDCDPTRPAGICSTESEHELAIQFASEVKSHLQEDFGMEPTLVGDSGNGCHLIYRIDLPNDAQSKQLIFSTLRAIAHQFDTEAVTIDTTTYNPARLCRIYGTINRKGDSTTLRPHRQTNILLSNSTAPTIPMETLMELIKRYSPPQPPADGRNQLSEQIRQIMAVCEEAGYGVAKSDASAKIPKVTLQRCPFNPEHSNSAILIKRGSLQFKCFHTSCQNNRWPQFFEQLPQHLKDRLPSPSIADIIDKHQLTELGNAHRLVQHYGEMIRYVHDTRSWLIWDGLRWKRDEDGQIARFAKDITERLLMDEATAEPDPELREAIVKFARRSQTKARIEAMIHLAGSEWGVAVKADAFDRDPWLLNLENGTLDLRTFQLRQHSQEDFITKLCPVQYIPDAACPKFMRFLGQVMQGNDAMIEFLQRAFGYTLTGNTDERCVFLCIGTGANGKTVLLSTMMKLLGDYAKKSSPETLLKKRSEGIPNDIADLKGARLVHVSEIERGRRIQEALVKEMTGGQETMKARFLYSEFFEFQPEFKLWIASNHRPEIGGRDEGIWSRIRLIPFEFTIPKAERRPAHLLMQEFEQELPGILNWTINGCRAWHSQHLGETPEILRATEEYRHDMDNLADFFEERCEFGQEYTEESSRLYQAYCEYAREANEKEVSRSVFGRMLKERGMKSVRDRNTRKWEGLRLRNSYQGPVPPPGDLIDLPAAGIS